MIDTQIRRDHVESWRLVRSLPFDQCWQAPSQPIRRLKERTAIVPGCSELSCVHAGGSRRIEPIPVSDSDVPHHSWTRCERGIKVRQTGHAETCHDFCDLSAKVGHSQAGETCTIESFRISAAVC